MLFWGFYTHICSLFLGLQKHYNWCLPANTGYLRYENLQIKVMIESCEIFVWLNLNLLICTLLQLPGIAKMFSSTMTVASAWIHLLAVDLFAGRYIPSINAKILPYQSYEEKKHKNNKNCILTIVLMLQNAQIIMMMMMNRQIYLDGLQHSLETRHSLVLCLLFCPVGILSHYITKVNSMYNRH